MNSRKVERIVHLIGASMREVGILMAVFGPLDAYYQIQDAPENPEKIFSIGAAIAIMGLIILGMGIFTESAKEEA